MDSLKGRNVNFEGPIRGLSTSSVPSWLGHDTTLKVKAPKILERKK